MAFCDHMVAAVLIEGSSHPGLAGEDQTYLMFKRVKPPYGIAPVAGHVDAFLSISQAMHAEAEEETGLQINPVYEMLVDGAWRDNACRREYSGAPGHQWWVGRATARGQLLENPQETKDLRWYGAGEIEDLAHRTHLHARGEISLPDFYHEPGIEPVWVEWLIKAGIVQPGGLDLEAITALANRTPVPFDEAGRA